MSGWIIKYTINILHIPDMIENKYSMFIELYMKGDPISRLKGNNFCKHV